MISFNIIMNYYSGLCSDTLFQYFIQANDNLFTKYGIDKPSSNGYTLEQQYVYLYESVVHNSNGALQFSNEYIENAFKSLTKEYQVRTRMVDIKAESENIKETLIQEEACLSLSMFGNAFGWHATPIAYDNEFYTVYTGNYVSLGQDFMAVKAIFNADDIGDGILFTRKASHEHLNDG